MTLSTSYIHNTHHLPLSKKKMAPKKEKDIVAPFIQGPSMDWTMDDGLYSRFQTWKISCNLIMDSELCELSEVRKINTLPRWSGDFGIKKLKSWQKEPSQLTLNFIWGEYESYCKPHSPMNCVHGMTSSRNSPKVHYLLMTG